MPSRRRSSDEFAQARNAKFTSKGGSKLGELYLDGVVEDIIYSNGENGYTVCTVNCGGEPITLVGIMPYVGEGETIRVQGEWQVHSTFGRQFRVDYFEKKLPTTQAAILKYLASGAIKGIGPVTAERIVARFGEDSLDVIENNPRWLCDIRGISPKRADSIHESYTEQFGMRTVMMFCNEFFGPALSVKIFKAYGWTWGGNTNGEPSCFYKEIN